MHASAMEIVALNPEIDLAVATTYSGTKLKVLSINKITYYLLPGINSRLSYDSGVESSWKHIKAKFAPGVIHIHGTECPHGLAYIRACGQEGVVLSIQGLVSVYSRYYLGGIDKDVLRKNITLRDMIKRDTVFSQAANFQRRAELEMEYIKLTKNIIGRTSWDKVHVTSINPIAKYHFCNETLRSGFYNFSWDYNGCDKHAIFLSQGHYPIKGLHQVVKALPLILKRYPSAKVYVGGSNIINKRYWRISGYGKYILRLLRTNNLSSSVIFTGLLDETKMIQQYLMCNVFVCPSSIENSANSIGEAQLLGVPCVASYVGGTPDLINHGITGLLYRFEEFEMLADCICQIFDDASFGQSLSRSGRNAARLRHNKEINAKTTNNIYTTICN
jgi:glycosyltransferase involved in cell wall biosynthesis